jgi:hypothetical protein
LSTDAAPEQPVVEQIAQPAGHHPVLGQGDTRIAFEQLFGPVAGIFQDLFIFGQVGYFQVKDSALLGAL